MSHLTRLESNSNFTLFTDESRRWCAFYEKRFDFSFGYTRVKNVVVRHGWHPTKHNSRFNPTPTQPIEEWRDLLIVNYFFWFNETRWFSRRKKSWVKKFPIFLSLPKTSSVKKNVNSKQVCLHTTLVDYKNLLLHSGGLLLKN